MEHLPVSLLDVAEELAIPLPTIHGVAIYGRARPDQAASSSSSTT